MDFCFAEECKEPKKNKDSTDITPVARSVSFLHGLEGGYMGSKHKYLIGSFDKCYFRSMEMSKWKLTKRNSFVRTLISNFFRPSLAAQDSLSGCLQIQSEELATNRPDIIVGSSWGGGIGLLLLSEGYWEGPIVLIAPALKHLLDVVGQTPKYQWDQIVQRINEKNLGKNIVIVHGTKDKVIPYSKSQEIVAQIHGAELITVPGGNHGLTNYLLTKDNLSKIAQNKYASFIKDQQRNLLAAYAPSNEVQQQQQSNQQKQLNL